MPYLIKDQTGTSYVLPIILLALTSQTFLLEGIFGRLNFINNEIKKDSINKSIDHQLVSKLKSRLSDESFGCPDLEMLKYPTTPEGTELPTETYPLKSDIPDCVLGVNERKIVQNLRIDLKKISPVSSNDSSSTIQAKMVYDLLGNYGDDAGKVIRTDIEVEHSFKVDTVTQNYFNLIFYGNDPKPIQLSTDVRMEVHGKTLNFSDNSRTVLDFVPGMNTGEPMVSYKDTFFTTHDELKLGMKSSDFDFRTWSDTFARGLKISALQGAVFPPLTEGVTNWSQEIDYGFVYQNDGYPLLSLPGKTMWMSGHQEEDRQFDPNRAGQNQVPIANSIAPGMHGLAPTCQVSPAEGNGKVYPYVFIGKDRNFTIDQRAINAGKDFCGLIVADTLTIRLGVTAMWGFRLFGLFYVKKLIVTGPRNTVVQFYNPLTNSHIAGTTITDNNTMNYMRRDHAVLATTYGHNFFLPILKSGHPNTNPEYHSTTYSQGVVDGDIPKTNAEARYVSHCELPDGSGFYADRFCWKNEIQPVDKTQLYADADYRKSLYFLVRDAL